MNGNKLKLTVITSKHLEGLNERKNSLEYILEYMSHDNLVPWNKISIKTDASNGYAYSGLCPELKSGLKKIHDNVLKAIDKTEEFIKIFMNINAIDSDEFDIMKEFLCNINENNTDLPSWVEYEKLNKKLAVKANEKFVIAMEVFKLR